MGPDLAPVRVDRVFSHLRTQLLRLVANMKSPRKLDPASTKALVGKVGSLHCPERKAIGTLAEGSTANAETERKRQQPPASKTPCDVIFFSAFMTSLSLEFMRISTRDVKDAANKPLTKTQSTFMERPLSPSLKRHITINHHTKHVSILERPTALKYYVHGLSKGAGKTLTAESRVLQFNQHVIMNR